MNSLMSVCQIKLQMTNDGQVILKVIAEVQQDQTVTSKQANVTLQCHFLENVYTQF